MATPDILFGDGDTAPVVPYVLAGQDGIRLDLGGSATVVIRYRLKNRNAAQVEEAVTILTPDVPDDDLVTPNVEWHPSSGVAAGEYWANWIVTLDGGDQLTLPNDRHLYMRVLPKP
jgi:hypothetical protein